MLVVDKDTEPNGSNLYTLVRNFERAVVNELQHFGSIFSPDNTLDKELSNRITKAICMTL